VAIEEDALDLGQEGVVAVDVPPARLDHADLRVREVVDGLLEKVRLRDKVGVEDGDQVP
jgi:hypothetical protein